MRARRLGAMGLGLVTALGAVGMGAARASGPGPAGAGGVAPLNINGKHVFWARGVRSAASLSTATANNLIYHGGAVETTPKVYLTFWGSEWTDPTNPAYQIPVKSPSGSDYNLGQLQNYIVSFFSGVGGTAWNNIQTQYCQGGSIGDLTCANSSGISSVTNPSSVLAGSGTTPRRLRRSSTRSAWPRTPSPTRWRPRRRAPPPTSATPPTSTPPSSCSPRRAGWRPGPRRSAPTAATTVRSPTPPGTACATRSSRTCSTWTSVRAPPSEAAA